MLKFYEAIRLGALIRPKADGQIFGAGASCAQGAALEAIGFPYHETPGKSASAPYRSAVEVFWPWVKSETACPACGAVGTVRLVVAHLNNSSKGTLGAGHNWTRQQIADWVETIEAVQPAPAEAPAVSVTA